jgi:hypothetical protein
MLNSDGCGEPEYHRHSRRKGKPLSPEHRAKLSATAKEREARKRILESLFLILHRYP